MLYTSTEAVSTPPATTTLVPPTRPQPDENRFVVIGALSVQVLAEIPYLNTLFTRVVVAGV